MLKHKRLFIFSLLSLLLVSAPVANATTPQFRSENDIIYYDPTPPACSTNSSTGSGVGVSGTAKENLRAILVYFTGKGLTLAAAAGIAANIKTESASTFNPAIIQGVTFAPPAQKNPDGSIIFDTVFKPVDGQGFGLSQWTYGGTTSSRQGGLYMLAKSRNVDIIDLNLQLDYIWKELTTSYRVSTLDRIKDMTDPRETTKIYMVNYEAPRDKSIAAQNGRADIGEAIYNEYKSQIPDGTGTTVDTTTVENPDGSTCEAIDDSSGGVGVSSDGFTFPLKTTQAVIKAGVDGSIWCYASTASCHHDYNAADIHAKTGTVIIAAKSGEVVNKTTDNCYNHTTGCNVTIMGDDGALYYYTHMNKNAIVNVGQKVQSAKQLGWVGDNTTAAGTAAHLHIDMLPGDQYKFRPECSGPACSGYPFINVQALLVPAYQKLPAGGA